MPKRLLVYLSLCCLLFLVACQAGSEESAATPTVGAPAQSAADLQAIKDYTLDNAGRMKEGSAALAATAQTYYDVMAGYDFDYQAAWAADSERLTELLTEARANWLVASQYYELDEGIIAGVPSLAFYDVWIDAGPSAEEAPDEAYQWTLELPDGRVLESPGNFFHHLLEPTIWGTDPDYTGLPVDLDGDGATTIGEALPEANVLLAASQGLDGATAQMIAAVEAWQPTLSDAFTAMVVMIPTMSEYFEQWKLSAYIAGESSDEAAFIGTSRLFDISGILNGLDFAYDNVSVLVEDADPALDTQIQDGFVELRGYVDDLYSQEQDGKRFTADEADLFGTEAQEMAIALAGQVSQAAALLNIAISE